MAAGGLFRLPMSIGVTPAEHRVIKGLTKKGQNLRNHMTDLKLIFTMPGERVTTEISQQEHPDTFAESKQVARRGGNVAGAARRETERELEHNFVSGRNFLDRNPDGLVEDTIGLPPLSETRTPLGIRRGILRTKVVQTAGIVSKKRWIRKSGRFYGIIPDGLFAARRIRRFLLVEANE